MEYFPYRVVLPRFSRRVWSWLYLLRRECSPDSVQYRIIFKLKTEINHTLQFVFSFCQCPTQLVRDSSKPGDFREEVIALAASVHHFALNPKTIILAIIP